MPITVGHSKSVTVADGTNTGIVRPSDWNSNHAVTLNISGTDIFGAFSNAGNVTFGTDTAGYITATAPAGGGAGDGWNIIAAGGSTANTTGTIVFSNSNGVSFGLNGATVTASHNGYTGNTTQFLTTAALSNHSHAFATTTTNGSVINVATSGSQGVTIAVPPYLTTAQAPGAYLTTAAQSDHSHGNPTLNLTNLSGTTASASNGLTISLSAAAPLAVTVFSNSNNVSFGLAGSTITATATFPSGTDTWYATGANTIAGTNTSGTFANDNYVLSGAGVASIGISNNTVVISVPSGGGAGDGFNEAQFTNTTANSTQAILWAGNSNGSGNVTMGLTGSTVTMSAPGGGGGGATLSKWAWPNLQFNTQTQQALQSTFVVWPFLAEEVSFDWLRFAKSVSMASTSFASTANTTFSFNQEETHRLVMYSRGTGASSQSLQSVMSTSASIGFSLNVYYGSATNTSQGHTMGITYPMSTGTSSFSTQYHTSNLSTFAISTGNNTRLTGMKMFDIAWASSLTNGEYFMAYNVSTASTTQGTNLSGARLLMSNIGMSMPNNTIGLFGSPNSNTIQWQSGMGSFTTVGGATTGSMGFSNISSSASHVMPHMTFLRI